MLKPITVFAFLTAAAQAAAATGWTTTSDKGIELHQIAADHVQVTIVCDPNGVWEPAEFHMTIKVGGAAIPAGKASISSGEATADLQVYDGGNIVKTDTWPELMAVFQSNEEKHLAYGNQAVNFVIPAFTADCLPK